MARSAPRHDRDAGGPADLLAAKAALRQEVWTAMRAAKVARFPGAAGRIPNFTGAEAAAERLRGLRPWLAAGIDWDDLTEEKIAAIPLLAAQRRQARHEPDLVRLHR